MPSTRKQEAREKRSRQSDVMSDIENMDVMLGGYSRSELESNSEDRSNEVNLGPDRPRQETIRNSEDFRSLLNTNSRDNSEITIETARLINSEVTNQVSRKLNELKKDLNTQILDSINLAINEKVLPAFQNTIGSQLNGFRANMDHRFSRLNRTADVRNLKKTLENLPESNLNSCDLHNLTRENS